MMGCFVSCFGACKHRKRLHLVAATLPPEDHIDEACAKVPQFCESTKQELVAEPVKPSTKSKRRLDDLLSLSGKKKVTFHLTVKSYEGISTGGITDEATRHKVDEGETKEREGREEPAKDNQAVSESINFKFSSDSEDERYKDRTNQEYRDLELEHSNLDDNGGEKDNLGAGGQGMVQEHSNLDDNNGGEQDNVGGDGGDGQGMVREHNNSDDNNGGEKDNVSGNGQGMVPKESSESLFSLSIESRKHEWDAEMDEKEVTSSVLKCSSHNTEQKASGSDRERNSEALNGDANSVLTPAENLTKLKTVKARATIVLQGEDKENMKVEQGFGEEISPGPSFKVCTKNVKAETKVKSFRDEEVAVDTSLSCWLVSTPISRTSPNSVGNSPSLEARSTRSGDDKPVLSVLTVEKLKHLSSSNAPRRLRSRTPDETHVIGTVGSYWRHTGRIIDPILALEAKGQ